MEFNLAVLPGDGIGPDVAMEGVNVLQTVAKKFGHQFNREYGLIGGVAIDESGSALPEETLKLCRGADAVLLGEILAFVVSPIGLDKRETADTWQVTIRARVTFTDLVANKVLFTNSNFTYQDQFEFPATGAGQIDIEVGSIDDISREFARAVVASILEGF